MKHAIVLIAATWISTSSALAQSHISTPGKKLAETIFGSIERNPDGQVDMGEFIAFGNSIRISMDANDDAKIDFDEFTAFDFGFRDIGEAAGQGQAYETAQKILFAFWDRDRNGQISTGEFHKSMISDFQRADVNGDAFLNEDEFLHNYIVNLAYRAALTDN